MSEKTKKSKTKKVGRIVVVSALVLLIGFVGVRFYFPFGKGIKTGQLNYVVYKGVVFKTYEGKLIQSGFRTNKPGGIESNEFIFSVSNKKVAEELMQQGGNIVELQYTEYFGALPWRGHSKFVVDSIVRIKPAPKESVFDILPAAGAE